MFDRFSQLFKMMGMLPQLQQQLEKFQQQLSRISAEGIAGGGLVQVRVNGQMEAVHCQIAPEALADRELVEELVKAAFNQAISKVRELIQAETAKFASSMGLPPGMGLPGLG